MNTMTIKTTTVTQLSVDSPFLLEGLTFDNTHDTAVAEQLASALIKVVDTRNVANTMYSHALEHNRQAFESVTCIMMHNIATIDDSGLSKQFGDTLRSRVARACKDIGIARLGFELQTNGYYKLVSAKPREVIKKEQVNKGDKTTANRIAGFKSKANKARVLATLIELAGLGLGDLDSIKGYMEKDLTSFDNAGK